MATGDDDLLLCQKSDPRVERLTLDGLGLLFQTGDENFGGWSRKVVLISLRHVGPGGMYKSDQSNLPYCESLILEGTCHSSISVGILLCLSYWQQVVSRASVEVFKTSPTTAAEQRCLGRNGWQIPVPGPWYVGPHCCVVETQSKCTIEALKGPVGTDCRWGVAEKKDSRFLD